MRGIEQSRTDLPSSRQPTTQVHGDGGDNLQGSHGPQGKKLPRPSPGHCCCNGYLIHSGEETSLAASVLEKNRKMLASLSF